MLWAHSEYLKLQRSAADGKVFDLVEPVFERYAGSAAERQPIEVWKFNRQVPYVVAGGRLRIQADARFLLHWTEDDWQHASDTRSVGTAVGVEFVDLQPQQQNAAIRFTFLWLDDNRWEGRDYIVEIQARADTRARKAAHGEPAIRVA